MQQRQLRDPRNFSDTIDASQRPPKRSFKNKFGGISDGTFGDDAIRSTNNDAASCKTYLKKLTLSQFKVPP